MEATRKVHEQPHSQHPAYVDAHLLIVVPGSVTDGEVTLRSAGGIPFGRVHARAVDPAARRSSPRWVRRTTPTPRRAGRRVLPDWIGSHVRTPDFLGGVPRQNRARFCSREQNRSYVPDPVIWPIVTARWFSGGTADVGPHNGLQSVEPIEQSLGVGAQGQLGFRSPELTRNRRYDRS